MCQRVYILSQFLWPDGAPTALYSEQLADRLLSRGYDARLVGGGGTYRRAERPLPRAPIDQVAHRSGERNRLWSAAVEYFSVARAFHDYIEANVERGDIVVASSAPPMTIRLWRAIRRLGARSVYWLQDYYPELLRSLAPFPSALRRPARRAFDDQLSQWDRVVKVAGNLGYGGTNSTVIRNWPTVEFSDMPAPRARTALYSGNLGYGHHVPSLVRACERLRDQGFTIAIRADGPGVRKLPAWLSAAPLCERPEDLARAYVEAEVHLVAAHPEIEEAFFPSKIWNSLAAGRQVVCTGFGARMAEEYQRSLESDFSHHLDLWIALIDELKGGSRVSRSCSCAA